MRIIKRKTLNGYSAMHPETKGTLDAWYHEVKKENWKTPEDVRFHFPKARTIPGDRVIFNILGNKYRLIVKVEYQAGLVYIRFVGTHKEYDRINAEGV